MQVTALFALLVLLALALAGAGLAAYRLAAWQRQAQDGLKRALVEADAQRERLFAVLRSVPHGLLVLDERSCVATGLLAGHYQTPWVHGSGTLFGVFLVRFS